MADIDNLLLNGQKLTPNLRRAITSAKLSTTTGEVSQLTATFNDPGWVFFASTTLQLGTTVEVSGYKFTIAAVETGDNSNVETLTVECRPLLVRRLKDRRGPRVLSNVSPTEWVQAECAAVGALHITEPSARRAQIGRDVPEAGRQETQADPPSSWTTFKRLARETGFIVFESANIVHFGRPSWLVNNVPAGAVTANYKTGTVPTRMTTVPTCRSSADDPDKTVSFDMPAASRTTFRAGKRLDVVNVPRFAGAYLLDTVEWDLLDETVDISVQASIPQDPVAQPPTKT